MDPHVGFDCHKILPNRFALALAAAARSRALNRGAEPRLDRQGVNASELALLEIASGAFVEDELAPYLFPRRQEHPPGRSVHHTRVSRRRPFRRCRRTRPLSAGGSPLMMQPTHEEK